MKEDIPSLVMNADRLSVIDLLHEYFIGSHYHYTNIITILTFTAINHLTDYFYKNYFL